jgi:SAM-dependent methyltransferase
MHREPTQAEREAVEEHNAAWAAEIKIVTGVDWRAAFYLPVDDVEFISSGFLDFFGHCLTPSVITEIGKPLFRSTAVEIGYGGGRLLLPACYTFGQVIGVDVHADEESTRKYLQWAHCPTNFILRREIASIPATTADFIYSYLTFQHFRKVCQVETYLREIKRVLTYRGIASIAYAVLNEEYSHRAWMRESVENVTQITLRLKPSFMRSLVAAISCPIVYEARLPRHPYSPEHVLGDQAVIVFRKA